MGFFSWFTGEPTINDLKIRIEECKRSIEVEKSNLARAKESKIKYQIEGCRKNIAALRREIARHREDIKRLKGK